MPKFELSYAGLPFTLPDPDLLAWLEEYLPARYLQETLPNVDITSLIKNLSGIALPDYPDRPPIRIHELWYPTGATRWAEFHGIATEDFTKKMEQFALDEYSPQLKGNYLTIQCEVEGPDELPGLSLLGDEATVRTKLYMLPPRKLTVTDGAFIADDDLQGINWITLVDERYFLQRKQIAALHPDLEQTWDDVLNQIYDELLPAFGPGWLTWDPIDPEYGLPNPDSALWSNYESAAVLLDAIAANIGRVVVRRMDGVIRLMALDEANLTLDINRFGDPDGDGPDTVGKLAGGDNFKQRAYRQLAMPEKITVTFPKYDQDIGYFDTREPTTFIRPSYGEVFAITLQVTETGVITPSTTGTTTGTGTTGTTSTTGTTPTTPLAASPGVIGTKIIRDTARAVYDEDGFLTNEQELIDLAVHLGNDYIGWLGTRAVDETYPGARNWIPEGFNDILWSYEEKLVTTRVMHKPWNFGVEEMQHGFGSGTTTTTSTTGTGSTSSTSSTTSTTLPPCEGECHWACGTPPDYQWHLTSSDCDADCVCSQPQYCCNCGGITGQTTITDCIRGIPTPQPYCGPPTTTSTTSTTTYTGTSTAAPTCTQCEWKCIFGLWYMMSEGGSAARCNGTVHAEGQDWPCLPCPYPSVFCGTEVCHETVTYCYISIYHPPPPVCTGRCDYFWNDNPPGWVWINPGICYTNRPDFAPCTCDRPGFDGTICAQRTLTQCYFHVTTTTGTGTSTTIYGTTTSPPPTCTSTCRFLWTGTAWNLICSNCPMQCSCPNLPAFDGTITNQTVELPCQDGTTTSSTTTTTHTSTTTSSTTSTTTTTHAPCTGTCSWTCFPPVWSLTFNTCTSPCACAPPPALCSEAGVGASGVCTSTTTSTTTTPGTTTSSTTTTTPTTCGPCVITGGPEPCGACSYSAFYPPGTSIPGTCGTYVLFSQGCTGVCKSCVCVPPPCNPPYPSMIGPSTACA